MASVIAIFFLKIEKRVLVGSLEQMELVLHMYIRGLHKLRMSCTVSASMQLSAFEPYITDFFVQQRKI